MAYNSEVSLSFDSQPNMTAPQHRRPMAHNQAPVPQFGYPTPPSFGSQQVPYGQPQSMPGPSAPPPNMAFMSFDLSSTGDFPPPGRVGPPVGAGAFGNSVSLGNAYFEDEPPLLEELGINIPQIVRKTTSALNPFRVNSDLFDDGDLSGPLIFVLLFGVCQLLAGKVHFGVLLGWSACSSTLLWAVANLMVGGEMQLAGVALYQCCSLFGYSLLPMVGLSGLALFLPHKGVIMAVAAGTVVAWCSRTCSSLLLTLLPPADDLRLLLVYLCALVYSSFALLIVF